jgi:hypothetical protein
MNVGRQQKPCPTVGWGRLMPGPAKSWTTNNTQSDSRSGKAHGWPNGLLVGKGPWQAQQNVSQESYSIADKQSVGKDMSVGKGFSRLDFP